MLTTDALHAAVDGDGDDRVLTLDGALQGLPDTAHGGSVLAVFDLVAAPTGPRRLDGHYLKRVPLGVPLRLHTRREPGRCHLELSEHDAVLVRGQVAAVAPPDGTPGGAVVPPPADDAMALPISRTCFACGVDNALGLHARLRADADAVGGTWTPRPGFSDAGGRLAPVALTTLLDEAAFWLGALATGEAGMTTELRVTLHAEAAAGSTITVDELKDMMDAGKDFELIDVREPNEFEIVSIPGAKLIPKDEILSGRALSQLPNDKPIVLHCKTGVRSAEALAAVKAAGFKDAVHVQGGVTAWATRIDKALPTY